MQTRTQAERDRYYRSRVRRCLTTSTEFVRRVRLHGIEYRLREGLGEGRWFRGSRELERAWLGQREHQLAGRGAPLFRGFFRKWWWLGGGAALYVPHTCSDDQIEPEVVKASGMVDDPRAGI